MDPTSYECEPNILQREAYIVQRSNATDILPTCAHLTGGIQRGEDRRDAAQRGGPGHGAGRVNIQSLHKLETISLNRANFRDLTSAYT